MANGLLEYTMTKKVFETVHCHNAYSYMIKMQNFPSSFSIVSAVIIWSFECHSLKKYDKNV